MSSPHPTAPASPIEKGSAFAEANWLRRAPIQPLLAPIWLGCERPGTELGPHVLSEGLKVRWNRADRRHLQADLLPPIEVPAPAPADALARLHRGTLEFLPEIAAAVVPLADEVERAIREGHLPVTMGGDHALAIGTIAGASRACGRLGMIWLDTHPDLNVPSSSESGHIHGMPVGIATGLANEELPELGALAGKERMIDPRDICMLGVRDIDPFEREMIRRHGVWGLSMDEWSDLGIVEGLLRAMSYMEGRGVDAIHVSFDLDVLDPPIMPGTGTRYQGGLSVREASRALRMLSDWKAPIHSLDIVELNPLLDLEGHSNEIAIHLMGTALGERMALNG
ncbi:MAG TPA: arginase [Thermomicrobiales bacterium]|nr:arginase [Thermomicrobiales bacterium]